MLTEGGSEDRVVVASKGHNMLHGISHGERLARGLKTPRFFKKINQGVGRSCLLFFRSGSESPRLVMEHVLPSVAAKAAMDCRPSGGGFFCELISL